ncbi:MAG TPA: amino acid permease [Luteibaculaceae bacterium]|nr:amino acid permease [Luteibaculaceae bacterium]
MSNTNPSKKLNLLDSSMLIMGSMIGSGIFLVTSAIARDVQTPGMVLLVWLITAVMTVFGALCYGELAAAFPNAGGQYVFLSKIYHKIFGFLYGWTVFTIIQTGTIAAVGIAFARFTGVFVPVISSKNMVLGLVSTEQLLGIAAIVLLTLSNFRAVKSSALVQNIFTIGKVGSLVLIVVFGLWAGFTGAGSVENFEPMWPDTFTLISWGVFGAAMVGSLFSADAWNNITYIAGEVENPKRNLPLSMLLGTGGVMLIYFLVNVVYLYILPIAKIQTAPEDRVGTLLMETMAGNYGLYLMAILIMISTFGCLNGIILTGARVYYAMAKDGLFFKPASKLNKHDVPANSLMMQGAWAIVLILSGSYNSLLDYVIFAVLLFYLLTVGGVIVLRRTQPDLPRPYKVFAYPFTPLIYLVLGLFVTISLVINKFENTYPGLILVFLGVPFYFLFRYLYRENKPS